MKNKFEQLNAQKIGFGTLQENAPANRWCKKMGFSLSKHQGNGNANLYELTLHVQAPTIAPPQAPFDSIAQSTTSAAALAYTFCLPCLNLDYCPIHGLRFGAIGSLAPLH